MRVISEAALYNRWRKCEIEKGTQISPMTLIRANSSLIYEDAPAGLPNPAARQRRERFPPDAFRRTCGKLLADFNVGFIQM